MAMLRHLKAMIVRILKNIELGLMTGPALSAHGLQNEGDLSCYYNDL